MVLLLTTVDQTQRVVRRTNQKTTQFQGARDAFESMTRRLSQATLNTYWRAYDSDVTKLNVSYKFRRQADLQFMSAPTARVFDALPSVSDSLIQPTEKSYPGDCIFFQAPLGFTQEPVSSSKPDVLRFARIDSALCACGYFVEYGPDPDRPTFINDLNYPNRYRYRLMEMTLPTESLTIFQRPNNTTNPNTLREEKTMREPRAYNINSEYYVGLVDKDREINDKWLPPLWMKQGIVRDTIKGITPKSKRFRYASVRAENIVAMIILPKLAERDRAVPKSDPVKYDPTVLELAPNYQFDSWRVLEGGATKDDRGRYIDNSARDNLLPPIVQVTMVAVDDVSMDRLNPSATNVPDLLTDIGGTQLFKVAKKVDEYQNDVQELEKALQKKGVNYRIFSTDVVLRGSKWSRDPKTK